MSLLWGRAHIMTDLVSLAQAEGGVGGRDSVKYSSNCRLFISIMHCALMP